MTSTKYEKSRLKQCYTDGFFEIRLIPSGRVGEAYVNIKINQHSQPTLLFCLDNEEEIESFIDDCIELANTKEELIRIIDMQYDIIKKNYNFFIEEQE